MAYVATLVRVSGLRRDRMSTLTVTVSGSYTQGTGELMLASDFGLSQLYNVFPNGAETTVGGYIPKPAPVSPVTGVFSSFNLLFLFGNYAAANGPLIEIPTAAYPAGLSGATYYLTAHGRL